MKEDRGIYNFTLSNNPITPRNPKLRTVTGPVEKYLRL